MTAVDPGVVRLVKRLVYPSDDVGNTEIISADPGLRALVEFAESFVNDNLAREDELSKEACVALKAWRGEDAT